MSSSFSSQSINSFRIRHVFIGFIAVSCIVNFQVLLSSSSGSMTTTMLDYDNMMDQQARLVSSSSSTPGNANSQHVAQLKATAQELEAAMNTMRVQLSGISSMINTLAKDNNINNTLVMTTANTKKQPQLLQQQQVVQSGTFQATKWTFPSIDERVKFYMGNWYNNRTTLREDICSKIKKPGTKLECDKDILQSKQYLSRQSDLKAKWEWIYLYDTLEVIKHAPAKNPNVIMRCGDSSSGTQGVPVVTKTRQVLLDKENKTQHDSNIIWPINVNRHYGGAEEIQTLIAQGRVPTWEEKQNTMLWRGGCTGLVKNPPREQTVKRYIQYNKSDIDIAFGNCDKKKNLVRSSMSLRNQIKYKYLVSIQGNDVATGLKWQLASNSVVFMAKPTKSSFAMEELLIPFVHYVPLDNYHTNLPEMLHWARNNDAHCKWIAEQSTEWMNRLWLSEQAQQDYLEVKKRLAEAYHDMFGKALEKC